MQQPPKRFDIDSSTSSTLTSIVSAVLIFVFLLLASVVGSRCDVAAAGRTDRERPRSHQGRARPDRRREGASRRRPPGQTVTPPGGRRCELTPLTREVCDGRGEFRIGVGSERLKGQTFPPPRCLFSFFLFCGQAPCQWSDHLLIKTWMCPFLHDEDDLIIFQFIC